MQLGEAGADYIAFGTPDFVADQQAARERRLDLIKWWAEIFEVPCVAFDVDSASDAAALAAAGADFVALRLSPSLAPADARETAAADARGAASRDIEGRDVMLLYPHRNFALIALVLLIAPVSMAAAETSSWSQRTTVAPRKDGAPQSGPAVPSPVPPKSVRTAPATGAAKAQRQRVRQDKCRSDEDAAYFAFDQGRYLTALDLAQKAAVKGDPQAHTLIARIYEEGFAVPKDEKVAAQWYRKGAELGDIEAVFALGVLAAQGRGMPKDETCRSALFRGRSRQGARRRQLQSRAPVPQGQGKPENPYRAFMHMRYAAEKGMVAAQYDLGTLYAAGAGVDANAFEAAQMDREGRQCRPYGSRHRVCRPALQGPRCGAR